MRIPFSLLVLGATALAHGLDPFTKFLNDNGLTAFASLLPILNQSSIGHGLIEKLQSGGNYSVLIPNNQAVAEISANLSGDALATIFSYHIIEGDFIDSRNGLVSQNLPKVTVGRTLLNDPTLVQLEGNKSQVLVWGKDSAGQVQILNQANPTTVQKFTVFSEYGRYGIGIIDHPLVPPPVFSQAATRGGGTNASYKLDKLVALFNNTLTDYPDHLLRTATQFMDGVFLDGFTFFMPTNEALEDREAAEAVGRASLVASDHGTTYVTVLKTIFGNHMIPSLTLYSTTLANSTSYVGELISTFTNTSGTFVSVGNSTARIVATDIICKNGVMHAIDKLLVDTRRHDQLR